MREAKAHTLCMVHMACCGLMQVLLFSTLLGEIQLQE
jgi:hypothetical protein